MGKTILLSGRPGVGKTTVIQKVVDRLPGWAGGFYTEEIRAGGRRQGFRIVTLDGEKAVLSHVDVDSSQRVSKYGVDVASLDRVGVAALRRAVEDCDIVIIDEIGKMELYSDAFKETVQEALESQVSVLGTIMKKRHPWADRIKKHPNVTVLEVTRDNRDAMPRRILELFRRKS